MRFYVAAASEEIALAEDVIAELRAIGHAIAFDWPAHIRAMNAADRDLSQTVREASARADLDAVGTCDAFWLLVPEGRSSGAWLELGYALGRKTRPLILVSGDWQRTIFAELADRRFPTHDEARTWIRAASTPRPPYQWAVKP